MATAATTGRARLMRNLAVIIAVTVASAGLLVGGSAAGVASSKAKSTVVKATDGTMAWGVSKYVLGANPAVTSLSEATTAEPPATFTAGTGWQFKNGTGTYDTKTNAIALAFPGALQFGNTNSGNYAFKFANPKVALDATGAGTLTADVSVRPAGAAAFNAAAPTVIANLTGATPAKTKSQVTVSVTPTAFADPLLLAAGDLSAFFKPTGSSNDAIKAPEPISITFSYKVKKKS